MRACVKRNRALLSVEALEARNLLAASFTGNAAVTFMLGVATDIAQKFGSAPNQNGSLKAVTQSAGQVLVDFGKLSSDVFGTLVDGAVAAGDAAAVAGITELPPASIAFIALAEQYKAVTKAPDRAATAAKLISDTQEAFEAPTSEHITNVGVDVAKLVGNDYLDVAADVVSDVQDAKKLSDSFGNLVQALQNYSQQVSPGLNAVLMEAESQVQSYTQMFNSYLQNVQTQLVQGAQQAEQAIMLFAQQHQAVNQDPDNDGDIDVDASGNVVDPT